jgi:FKBP-type peptidyl-prolyl cis-trans isomerase SlyD
MENNKKPISVADDVVVSMDYVLTVNGEVVDSTEGDDPIEFLQGHENIIPGLERELYGMMVGDTKKVRVPAKDAYGEIDPDAIVDVPRNEIPKEIPLKPGVELTVKDEDGDLLDARIVSVAKDTVKLDFNHPLAGKDLDFEVTVTGLREPDAEELEHGHVHGDEEDFEEEEEELFYEDDEEFVDEGDLDDLESLDNRNN